MPCEKCHHKIVAEKLFVGNGITSRPCPLCGCQNYTFPNDMRSSADALEPSNVCCDCGVPITKEAKRCLYCAQLYLWAVRSLTGEKPNHGPQVI